MHVLSLYLKTNFLTMTRSNNHLLISENIYFTTCKLWISLFNKGLQQLLNEALIFFWLSNQSLIEWFYFLPCGVYTTRP